METQPLWHTSWTQMIPLCPGLLFRVSNGIKGCPEIKLHRHVCSTFICLVVCHHCCDTVFNQIGIFLNKSLHYSKVIELNQNSFINILPKTVRLEMLYTRWILKDPGCPSFEIFNHINIKASENNFDERVSWQGVKMNRGASKHPQERYCWSH